jgi:predicted nucleic acid-binding protein
MKVVADTNVVVSMLLWGKSLERLFLMVNRRKILLLKLKKFKNIPIYSPARFLNLNTGIV